MNAFKNGLDLIALSLLNKISLTMRQILRNHMSSNFMNIEKELRETDKTFCYVIKEGRKNFRRQHMANKKRNK